MKTKINELVDKYRFNLFDEYCLYNETELTDMLKKDLNTLFDVKPSCKKFKEKEEMTFEEYRRKHYELKDGKYSDKRDNTPYKFWDARDKYRKEFKVKP